MTAADTNLLIASAARWALHYAKQSPRPLFATPCFYFTLDSRGLPNSESIHFVQLSDALHAPPEALLRRAKNLRHPPETSAAVLAYALSEDGEIFCDAIGSPHQFLLYTYVPTILGGPIFERRLAQEVHSEVRILPDRHIPFDLRAAPRLNDQAAPMAPPTVTIPAGASVH